MISVQRASWYRFVCLGLSLLFLYSLIAPQAVSAQNQRKQVLRILPGDAIHLSVYDGHSVTEENRFISTFHEKDFLVDNQGEIHLYSLGKLRIAGLSAENISSLLQEKFKPYAKEPIVIVVPLIRITLSGGFKQPGMYRVKRETSFWDMVRLAEGFEKSSAERIELIRNGKIVAKDFSRATNKGISLLELGIQSGDEIYAAPSKKITFDKIMRYTQFGLQLVLLYYTIENRKN